MRTSLASAYLTSLQVRGRDTMPFFSQARRPFGFREFFAWSAPKTKKVGLVVVAVAAAAAVFVVDTCRLSFSLQRAAFREKVPGLRFFFVVSG